MLSYEAIGSELTLVENDSNPSDSSATYSGLGMIMMMMGQAGSSK